MATEPTEPTLTIWIVVGSKPPTIYGDERRFKVTLGRFISRGEDLLGQAEAVRQRVAAERDRTGLFAFMIEQPWVDDVGRWRHNVLRAMQRHLGNQPESLLPRLTQWMPPETGKPRHARTLDTMEPWLRDAIDELLALREALGVSRNVTVADSPGRFDELRASGLVDTAVIDGYAKEMANPRTPKQLLDAIAASKEITEATLRAALERLAVAWGKKDDLPSLMKKWRLAVSALAPPDPAGQEVLDRTQAALGSVVTFLGEWRNRYGRGHGRPKHPPGLQRRHARLAADAAETAVRFVVTTLDDFARLPPPPPGSS